MQRYLITGGAGFIGSNFIHFLLEKYVDIEILNLDKLTYAGNLDNLRDCENRSNYKFFKVDICDRKVVDTLMMDCDYVINFAAESHVDRSIGAPDDFIKTDIFGTFVLLESARKYSIKKFIQISTDEVYGSIETGSFKEIDPLMPSSPYSASKAGADRLAYSYFITYHLPIIITRCSNNFGPFQYPEKLIPLFITNAIEDKQVPLYGDGMNVRDWIYVVDHCAAIDFILHNGVDGEVYNIGGNNEKNNLEITQKILKGLNKSSDLIRYVKDRPGHDRRYSLDCTRLTKLGWNPRYQFDEAMDLTIKWYKDNRRWWEKIKSGEYLEYYKRQYNI